MKASKPYFSHDICAKSDEKIIRLMFDFRKTKKDFSEETLRELIAHAAYGIYWEIIEYLHENSLKITELNMLADELRIDSEILKRILCNYDLFKEQNGKYISERVLRNLKLQEEKSEIARKKANSRWKNKKYKAPEGEPPRPDEPEEAPEYDEEFVMSIIRIYNEKFKKSQIVSKENKERIFKIHTKNKLTLDIWETIFSNAKRGWDIGDKKNVPPNLKKILDEWDSFASDDYFLAPDREAIAAKKEAEAIKNIEERQKRELENERYNKLRKQKYEAISSKEDALAYLYEYSVVKDVRFLRTSNTFKELSKKYSITLDEAQNYFSSKGAKNV